MQPTFALPPTNVGAPHFRLSPLSQTLISLGMVSTSEAMLAQRSSRITGQRLADVYGHRYSISSLTLVTVFAELYGCQIVDPTRHTIDSDALKLFGAQSALRMSVLPWRRLGKAMVILTDKPDQFLDHLPKLVAVFGAVRMGLTTSDQLHSTIIAHASTTMVHAAESKVPVDQSCRSWNARKAGIICATAAIGLSVAIYFAPAIVLAVFAAIAIALLVMTTFLKIAAMFVYHEHVSENLTPLTGALPRISIMIPLFRENEIADHLLSRLRDLNYPTELLDICLVLESDDSTTRNALGRAVLPTWIRPIIVPQGSLRTKPRALNYALDFADGDIIGVYDAEDAPESDQLLKVAARFANSDPKVACLQGVLDYYNDSSNWLTRCFTIEYASWFRVILPGLERLGLVVPLGGTTLFFRRKILEELGGWDAHNVTEDADLGVRLARAGYRTELINTVTQEEANGRAWPWVKQRSRWLKGYAITYAVHMRSPRKLWNDLGPRKFWGVHLLFGGTLIQFVLAPILWSFWLLPFGVHHPLLNFLSPAMFWALGATFFASEAVSLTVAWLALGQANKRWLWKWAFSLQLYFPLAAMAAYKGLAELVWKPFYWDKTMHGVLMPRARGWRGKFRASTSQPARRASIE